jgi:hypothetical protein
MDLNKLKVVELKARLKKLGLNANGLKQELVDRLGQALNASEAESKAVPDEETEQKTEEEKAEALYAHGEEGVREDVASEQYIESESMDHEEISVDSKSAEAENNDMKVDIANEKHTEIATGMPPASDEEEKIHETSEESFPNDEPIRDVPAVEPNVSVISKEVLSNEERPSQTNGTQMAMDVDMAEIEDKSRNASDQQSPSKRPVIDDDGLRETKRPRSTTSISMHTPTKAVYIQNLLRPLVPRVFRQYIESIADGRTEFFWLDKLKSHCFAIFSTVDDAVMVRDRLHNNRYPEDEMARKPLFVDYVPESSVQEWVDQETSNASKRWVVDYKQENGRVEAVLNALEVKREEPRDIDKRELDKRDFDRYDLHRRDFDRPDRYGRARETGYRGGYDRPKVRETRWRPPILYREAR